jgi:hypothetical protein
MRPSAGTGNTPVEFAGGLGLGFLDDPDGQKAKLAILNEEHRDLDSAIHALVETGSKDQLKIARLKKRKLSLKDQIASLQDQLTPDIIA